MFIADLFCWGIGRAVVIVTHDQGRDCTDEVK